MARFRLVLTPTDLKGDFTNGMDCPVHRSLSRQFPKNQFLVGPWQIFINGHNVETANQITAAVIEPMQKVGKLRHIYLDIPAEVLKV